MPFSQILFEVADSGIAVVTIDRPEKRNALSSAVMAELSEAFDRIAADAAIRAAVITGKGEKAFVAGADINELAELTPAAMREFALRGRAVFRKLETLGKPVAAAVNGAALGGGLELAMACTVRFASENALLGQPEVKLGVIPGYGGTQRLPRLVGRGRALELLLSGEAISAGEAFRIGLVNAVLTQENLLSHSIAWLEKVLTNAPRALELVLESVDVGLDVGIEAGLRFEAAAFGVCAATEDRREGTRAFLEKRRPAFTGK